MEKTPTLTAGEAKGEEIRRVVRITTADS